MDVVADADGNPDQDIWCFPNFEDKQEEGMEIQYDLVLGDRLCCIENQGVLSSSEKFCQNLWNSLKWANYERLTSMEVMIW